MKDTYIKSNLSSFTNRFFVLINGYPNGMKFNRRFSITLLLIAAIITMTSNSFAQFIQQGNKLVGNDISGTAAEGNSVTISADGNTVAFGGIGDNGLAGAVWVFTRSNGIWTQLGNKLTGSGSAGNSTLGNSLACSGDGSTLIAGGQMDDNYVGAAWVFTNSNGVWNQQGDKLVGLGYVGKSQQGFSVALSEDGNTAIVGGPGDYANQGAAWIFTRSNGVWTQQGDKVVGSKPVGGSFEGQTVALSADGNTAIIGGASDDNYRGAVWVFARSNGVWTQQGNKLVVPSGIQVTLGTSVSISGDGNTIAAGGSNGEGAVWIFSKSNGIWQQQQDSLVGAPAFGPSSQGYSVAISSDGNSIVEGGPTENNEHGAAWIFKRSNGVWSQIGDKLVGTGAIGQSYQGNSVAISSDGNTAIIGGVHDNTYEGSAWIYTNKVTGITKELMLTPTEFALSQNYPNPFNPTTLISYQIPSAGQVQLRIYDILGREVATLVDKEESSGNYKVIFDGSKYSSGVYFYKLSTDGFFQSKKMLLIK